MYRIIFLTIPSKVEFSSFNQGVLRVRKRVTMMVITVSVIFGICWGTNSIIYFLIYVASYKFGAIGVTIADMMVLFNSAVNPFVYALLNHQFREKVRIMVCCSRSSPSSRINVQHTRNPHNMDIVENSSSHPAHPAGPGPSHRSISMHAV